MGDDSSSATFDIDRAKALLDRAFNDALYLHYHWPTLTDPVTPLADLWAGTAQFADILPENLRQEAQARIPILTGASTERVGEVRQVYRDWAATYDLPTNPLIAIEEPHMLELIGDVVGLTVADISCGTGRYSRYAMSNGAALANGVDITPEMLAVALNHAQTQPGMHFAQGILDAIPLASGRYDLAVCALALEYVPDVARPIAEMARLLKPGGKLVISDFHPTLMMVGTRTGVRNYVHRVQDFFDAFTAAGLRLTDLREPTVSELPADFRSRMSPFVRTCGHMPFVLILRGEKL